MSALHNLGLVCSGAAPDSGKTLADMLTDAELDEVASWASGVGPDKKLLVKWQQKQQTDGGGGGSSSGETGARAGAGGGTSGLLEAVVRAVKCMVRG